MLKNFVEIAKVGSTYKLDGELNLYTFSNSIETLLNCGIWYIKLPNNNYWQELKGESIFRRGNKIYIKFANINDVEKSKKYVNSLIGVPKESLPKLDKNEVYFKDLIGCNITNITNDSFGFVVNIIETGANDVLVCKKNNKEYLIPYVKKYIVSENIFLKKIIVDWQYNY